MKVNPELYCEYCKKVTVHSRIITSNADTPPFERREVISCIVCNNIDYEDIIYIE